MNDTQHSGPGTSTLRRPSITFPVDDVAPVRSRLATVKPLDAVRALLDAPAGRFAADESAQGNPTRGRVEACWGYSQDCVAGIGLHPLIAATHLAFSEHRPLVLSPDVIWVTIVQGLAQHVQLSPETYRRLLVHHEGKREISVIRTDLHRGSPENPWAEVVADLVSLLRGEIGETAQRFVCDFTTTGPLERTVSEVALLDVLQPYFSFNVVCICGIPSVTLEGTPADWQKLRQKVDYLAPFGLDWWLDELRPICDQFARAAGGDIDGVHWRRMYKIRQAYGEQVINGWLGKLFPYTKDCNTGKFSHRNPLLHPEVEMEIRKLEKEEEGDGPRTPFPFNAPGVCAEELPRGLSQVPFTLTDPAGKKRAMEFLAGPVVVTQDDETGALRSTLGWAVREAAPIEQAIARLADHGVEPAKDELLVEAFHVHHSDYMPTDVVRFYQQFGSATIYGEDRVPLYRILPLAEWVDPEAQSQPPDGEFERVREFKMVSQLRFAESSDGVGILIKVERSEGDDLGSVVIGCGRDGKPVPQTGQKVAKSFTDFLLKALDGGVFRGSRSV